MHDELTEVGPMPAPARNRARRINLAPVKRLSRAHLELARHAELGRDMQHALNAALERVGSQIGQPLQGIASILDLTLQPLQHLRQESLYIVVELAALGTTALVELETPVVTHLLGLVAGSNNPGGVVHTLTRIESAALGWLVLSAIAGLRSVPICEARFGPRLMTITLDRGDALRAVDATARHLAVEVQVSGTQPLGSARVLIPGKFLQLAAQATPISEFPPAQEAVLSASVSTEVRYGHTTLLREHLHQVGVGDVIVFSDTQLHDGRLLGPARLRSHCFFATGEFTTEGFLLADLSSLPPLEPAMSNNLRVDVEIELTTLQIPIRELGAIAPGSVLPLHINAAQQVTLRIDGKRVASAELVEVEGEIGARIISMVEAAP